VTNEYDKNSDRWQFKAADFTEFTGQQDRQCTYNETLRGLPATTFAIEWQYFPHIVSAYL
jgi:hypothetical protein